MKTVISYDLPVSCNVILTVYDIMGCEVEIINISTKKHNYLFNAISLIDKNPPILRSTSNDEKESNLIFTN